MDKKYPDYLCYYYREKPTFDSILDMGISNAKSFLENNDNEFRSGKNYLDLRMEIESWLKTQFLEKGGKPTRKNLFCMSLGPELVYEKEDDYKHKMIIPLEIFNRSQISFTYVDSMFTKEGRKPILFMKDEIEMMIDKYGTGYTEAQIWDDSPLLVIKEEYAKSGRNNFILENDILAVYRT